MLLSSQSGTTMDQVLDKHQEKTVKSFHILRQYSKTLSVVVTTSWLSVMPTHQLESQFLQTNTIKLLKFLATQKLHLKFHGNILPPCPASNDGSDQEGDENDKFDKESEGDENDKSDKESEGDENGKSDKRVRVMRSSCIYLTF